MSFAKILFAAAAPLALLAGCATGLPTQVSRFQSLPLPAGQTFAIVASDPDNRGGIEFSQYADLVRRALVAEGYSAVQSPSQASLIVSLDYGVDNGQSKVVSSGFGRSGFGYGGFGAGYGRFGSPYYSHFGGPRLGYGYGWNDPFFFGGGGFDDVRSYTVYTSYLDMDIRRADGQSVFEGMVKARSRTDRLTALVPNLVEAMFTGFPGRSGETVHITVQPERRGR